MQPTWRRSSAPCWPAARGGRAGWGPPLRGSTRGGRVGAEVSASRRGSQASTRTPGMEQESSAARGPSRRTHGGAAAGGAAQRLFVLAVIRLSAPGVELRKG